MTMFTLPNFCRVCLKYDKHLIDLANIENEPNETLMTKLQHCVSEVEWTVFKPLLCHPCIKRLNIAYMFKKQCVQSAGVLKNYIELVKESQMKAESQISVSNENILGSSGGAYMLLPNQKYVKILVSGTTGNVSSSAQSNTFQNVFLNVIPATTINAINTTPIIEPISAPNSVSNKDTKQNLFFNLNNTFQNFIPVATAAPAVVPQPVEIVDSKIEPVGAKPNTVSVNLNPLFNASKSEEVSVEVDPTVFGLGDYDGSESNEDDNNDYDEVISQAKITLKDFKTNGENMPHNGRDDQKYYVPILPKAQQEDFVTSGQHFLFSHSDNRGALVCESCQKSFSSKKMLRTHINQFHMGKLPFKCETCYTEFLTRSEYELCGKSHQLEAEAFNQSITLQDLANDSYQGSADPEADIPPSANGRYVCNVCCSTFNSAAGLLRHKVRKHNHANKKKYFIKGMKNARCDICNREFSTTSYLQLHKKLHLRDDIGYKYKVFGKSKYVEVDIKDDKYSDCKDEEQLSDGDFKQEKITDEYECTTNGEKHAKSLNDTTERVKMETENSEQHSDDNNSHIDDENFPNECSSYPENSNDGDSDDEDMSEKN